MSAIDPVPPRTLGLGQMQALAARIAGQLRSGDVLALSGDLGAGKTAFSRALIQAVSPGSPDVTSPTFMLMQSYPVTLSGGVQETLWHLDLYRLEDMSEAHALGLEELWPHIVLIEWPERIVPLLPEHALHIDFSFPADHCLRTLRCTPNGTWRERLQAVW